MINKKIILLLLVFQICLIKVSFGLPSSLENIVGGIKQIPSMATTIPSFVKNTFLPHSMRKTSLLFFTPCLINKLSNKNSKYEAMNKYLNKLLSTDQKNEVAKITGNKASSSEIHFISDKVGININEKEIWNNQKNTIQKDPSNETNIKIYNKIKYVESLFTSFTLDDSNINMLQLDLDDNISFWKKFKMIACKTLTDYIFLPFPTILIGLSIMGKEENKTVGWSFMIPALVAIIKIAHYNLLKKIYQKQAHQPSEENKSEENNDLQFTLLSSRLKNPSTTSLLTIASVIFLLYSWKKSTAQ